MINIKELRHRKENMYLRICQIAGVLLWFIIIVGTFGLALIFIFFTAISLWVSQQFFKNPFKIF